MSGALREGDGEQGCLDTCPSGSAPLLILDRPFRFVHRVEIIELAI